MKILPKKHRGEIRRKHRKHIFMIAEGKNKTEKYYFQSYFRNVSDCMLTFSTDDATDPERLVKCLLRKCAESGFDPKYGDIAYCLVDHDVDSAKDSQIQNAEKISNSQCRPIIIVSNPCFELWLLCHYRESTKQYQNSYEVLKELRTYMPNYDKNREDIYELTKKDLFVAKQRAETLEMFNKEQKRNFHKYDFQPSTEVYKIF